MLDHDQYRTKNNQTKARSSGTSQTVSLPLKSHKVKRVNGWRAFCWKIFAGNRQRQP
jgi:hypothetical protein